MKLALFLAAAVVIAAIYYQQGAEQRNLHAVLDVCEHHLYRDFKIGMVYDKGFKDKCEAAWDKFREETAIIEHKRDDDDLKFLKRSTP